MTPRTNIEFVQHRLALHLQGDAPTSTSCLVRWMTTAGGDEDAGTGALVGGVNTHHSGLLRGFGHVEPAQSVVRHFAEIQTGDLLLDVAADAEIYELPSGLGVPLSDVEPHGLRVTWDGREYVQKKAGEELLARWDVTFQSRKTMRTLLLRPAT